MYEDRSGAVCTVILSLVMVTVSAATQENAGKGDRDLRSRMAGAWRSVPGKPSADGGHDIRTKNEGGRHQTESKGTASSTDKGEVPTFRGVPLDAIAQRLAELDQVLYFDGDLCVMVSEGRQMILHVQYQDGVARRTLPDTGMALPGEFSIEDGLLVMRVPSVPFSVHYRRLKEIPESVRLDPYPVGSRMPDDTERVAIQKEIARRSQRDQDVRWKAIEADKKSRADGIPAAPTVEGGKPGRTDAVQAMAAVDQDNTHRMTELIRDVGWLDEARFGRDTQLGAFLIVQHSGNLRLMRTALPLLEREAKRDPKWGQYCALLYDRVQVSLGRRQRYGTQAQTNPDGSMTIGRLEDRRRVDEWRKEMGLEPLSDYVKTLARQYGAKVTIGE